MTLDSRAPQDVRLHAGGNKAGVRERRHQEHRRVRARRPCKPSLVNDPCFAAGSGKRHGAVRDGTALTDHLPEEMERGYSISLGCAYAGWMNSNTNFIYTRRDLHFQRDALAGIAAADGALCVIGGASGLEVGTERVFRAAAAKQDPVLSVAARTRTRAAPRAGSWKPTSPPNAKHGLPVSGRAHRIHQRH